MDDKLINGILHWQNKRWERIKFWRNSELPMEARHFLIRKEIELIRSQKKRLQKLINEKAN